MGERTIRADAQTARVLFAQIALHPRGVHVGDPDVRRPAVDVLAVRRPADIAIMAHAAEPAVDHRGLAEVVAHVLKDVDQLLRDPASVQFAAATAAEFGLGEVLAQPTVCRHGSTFVLIGWTECTRPHQVASAETTPTIEPINSSVAPMSIS